MGKDLKGREIGEGISQRSDGYFLARFTNSSGKRVVKYFDNVADARKWILAARYEDMNEDHVAMQYSMTVDEWFEYWIKNFKKDLSPNTIRNYRERYNNDCRQQIGKMLLADVKGVHCQKILNDIQSVYARGTVYQTYICLGTMFKCALKNELIEKHPLDSVELKFKRLKRKQIRALTIEEQESFLEYAKKTRMSKQFRLLLNTGLRTGELIGLTWDNFDRKNRMLTVDKSLEYRHEWKAWRAGPPKTLSGFRKIPLTEEAYDILMELYKGRKDRKEDESLSQVLKFVDSRSGIEREVCLRDLIFINWRTGKPMKNSTYDNDIYKICDKAGIKPFCMHVLRHTFATRCIERGVSPKSLQKILGHAQLSTTMDTYVHVTDESLELAMKTFEAAV